MRLRTEEEEGELVGGILAPLVQAAEGDVEADGESREVLRAVGVAQVDDLVELEPEGLDDLQRPRVVQRP